MKVIYLTGLCLLCILLSGPLKANNVQLQHLEWLDAATIAVEIRWEHSWRLDSSTAPGNHDAVWLFGKIRTATGSWTHLEWSLLAAAHQVFDPSFQIRPAPDGKGLIVERSMAGAGSVNWTRLELGLQTAVDPGTYALQLMGLEMIWVPEGPFFLGDSSSFHHFRDGQTGRPFRITGEQVVRVDSVPGALYDDGAKPPASDLPAVYPKGYGGFYAMKYELSQEQYRDFLNSLTYAQQALRTSRPPNTVAGLPALSGSLTQRQRNGLVITNPGIPGGQPAIYACEAMEDGVWNGPDDGQNRACNFLNWDDLCAYLDWAGLRPMTELEFEKVCRGPVLPLPGAFAWGTDSVIDANTVVQDGLPSETVAEQANALAGLASHGYAGPDGPLRVGFGAHDSSDRRQSGAAYYGAMEMSGNLWELCVGVNEPGLAFDGRHGDGTLNADGRADVPNWPTAEGAGHRGGALNSGIIGPFRDLAISDRFYADLPPLLRRNTVGGRGVRSGW